MRSIPVRATAYEAGEYMDYIILVFDHNPEDGTYRDDIMNAAEVNIQFSEARKQHGTSEEDARREYEEAISDIAKVSGISEYQKGTSPAE